MLYGRIRTADVPLGKDPFAMAGAVKLGFAPFASPAKDVLIVFTGKASARAMRSRMVRRRRAVSSRALQSMVVNELTRFTDDRAIEGRDACRAIVADAKL